MNHKVDKCYSKHGFPPWYKRKNEYISNNCFSDNNIDTKESKNDEHTHQLVENQNDITSTQERMEQI